MRRAPETGYDFGAKRNYRRQVWGTIKHALARHDLAYASRATANVAFLPSSEGAEIRLALAAGFKEINLYAIDESPAVLASAPWRRLYPKVNIYGSELSRAAARLKDDGVTIDIANLDLCGCISTKTEGALQALSEAEVLAADSLIAVTVLRGRESFAFQRNVIEQLDVECYDDDRPVKFLDAAYQDLRDNWRGAQQPTVLDCVRYEWIMNALTRSPVEHAVTYETNSYRSSNGQTMFWCLVGLHREQESQA